MSYQVLARRWRPQIFADVVGQDAVVQTLQRALSTDRVAHAFLFCGSRGIGKTTLARIMAKALSCANGITATPCGECVHCTEIMKGSAVDVVEIDGASNNSVDNIRDLRETARFQPQSCRFKIFIIDEVHMLSVAAFNALLKTLEEPPPHVKFIFATTEAHKIPVTILSRCQRYDFKRIASSVIVDRLQFVLGAEGLTIEDAGLAIIARAAEGGMRDALSLADQVLSFAGDGATAEQVAESLGLIDRRTIVRAAGAIIDRDAKAALDEIDRCFEQGYDLRQFAEALCAEYRHLNIAAACGSVRGFADLAHDDLEAIDARAKKAETRDLMRLFAGTLEGLDRMGDTENEKLCLELTVLRLCERPLLTDAMAVSEALVRLDALARGKPVPPLSGGGASSGGRAQRLVSETLSVPSVAQTGADDQSPNDAGDHPPPGDGPSPAEQVAETSFSRADTVSLRPADLDMDGAEKAASGAPTHGSAASATASTPSVGVQDSAGTTEPAATEPAATEPSDDHDDDDDDGEEIDLGLELEGVDETWITFVREVERRARSLLGGALAHGSFMGVDDASAGPLVKVAFSQAHHEERVKAALDREEIKGPLASFGEGAFLDVVTCPDRPPLSVFAARRVAREKIQAALEAHAREHPTVKKALELFGGEIRAVRS